MRKITVFYDETGYTFTWMKALLWAHNELKGFGYSVRFENIFCFLPKFDRIGLVSNAMNKKHDIVFLMFHHSTSKIMGMPEEELHKILAKMQENCNLLCWFDTADSTGSTRFDVLPYVDLYFKKQWYQKSDYYVNPKNNEKWFNNYYKDKYNLEDLPVDPEALKKGCRLKKEYIDKLRISWNLGYCDLLAKNGISKYLSPFQMIDWEYMNPESKRIYDIHYRGTLHKTLSGYQRFMLCERLKNLNNLNMPDNWNGARVTKKAFIEEAKQSHTIVSPYGYGEVCVRDFEAFAYGVTLVKPTMENIITFPNVYIPDYTYIATDLDFNNLDEIYENYLSRPKYFKEIASQGQEEYKKYRESKQIFAEHLVRELEAKDCTVLFTDR